MIVWLNGPFGAGKTAAADELVERDAMWRRFDPEMVGFLVRSQFQDYGYADFQQLSAWRRLTPIVADDIARETGQHLVIVQTVLVQQYWNELAEGIRDRGHALHHVLIEAPADTLRRRICEDEVLHRAAGWRLEHIPVFLEARESWLADDAELVVDTSVVSPRRVAEEIATAIRGWAAEVKR